MVRNGRSHDLTPCKFVQPAYVATLSSELANESQSDSIRMGAGVAIKNALTGKVC
jgi:hypothetical protein